MSKPDGSALIHELLAAPAAFCESGRAYNLLQAYFAGFPKETLRPLLKSDDSSVQRSAAFIVSELGIAASSLVSEFPRLLSSQDQHVVWYAVEALAVCAKGESVSHFAHVVLMLESGLDPIRRLAMRLMARVDHSQLVGAREYFDDQDGRFEPYVRGLSALTNGRLDELGIRAMLEHIDPLVRRFGAIAASRFRSQFPASWLLVKESQDEDVRSILR